MRHIALIAALMAALVVTAAEANPKGNKGHGHSDDENGHFSQNCPPGLAKKNPPCIPPGLARKGHDDQGDDDHEVVRVPAYHDYRPGTLLPPPYVVLLDPRDYSHWPNASLVRYGDFLYQIDPLTGRILQNVGPVSDWNWRWSGLDLNHCLPSPLLPNAPCLPYAPHYPVGADPFRVGDRLPPGYTVLLTPDMQTAPNSQFVRMNDSLYQIDSTTGLVLQLIGTIANLFR